MLIPEDDKSRQSASYVEEGDALPPAYTSTDTSRSALSQDVSPTPLEPPPPASSASAPSFPFPPSTNYLTISRTNDSIKGKYAIDPSMQMPASVVPSVGPDGSKLNMRLASTNGAVDATIELLRGPDAKGAARLEATSTNGSVSLTIRDKRLHRFRLLAKSTNGKITLRIPDTFTGPVSTKMQNGRLIFSEAVRARLTTLSVDRQEGLHFIGDLAASGFEDEASWPGDAMRVEAQNGRVQIGWADEREEAPSADRKGFFSRFFS